MDKPTPDHYKVLKMMPIEYLMISTPPEQFNGFLKGNIVKYVIRADMKKTE
jgi:hypothetical protein